MKGGGAVAEQRRQSEGGGAVAEQLRMDAKAGAGGAVDQLAVLDLARTVSGGSSRDEPASRPLLATCDTVCHVPQDFFHQCDHLTQLVKDAEDDGEPIRVQASAGDLAAVLQLVDELPRAGSPAETWGIDQALVACRVAAFLGHRDLSRRGLGVLAAAITGAESLPELVGAADRLPPPLRAAVAVVLQGSDAPLTADAIAGVIAAVTTHGAATEVAPEPEPEPAAASDERLVLHLELCDTDTMFSLLASLEVSTCLRLVQSSHAACSMVFASDFKFAFRAWSAVLSTLRDDDEPQHMSLVDAAVAQAIEELDDDASATAGGFAEQLTELIQLVVELQGHTAHLTSDLPADERPEEGLARLAWVETQALKLGGTTDARGRLIARVLVPQLAQMVQDSSNQRPPHNLADQAYAAAARVIEATAVAAGASAQAELDAATTDGAPTTEQTQRLDAAWINCKGAHHLQRVVFGYLNRFHIPRSTTKPLQEMCTDAKCPIWDAWIERGWSPPAATVAPAIHTIRLISGDKEVFEVSLEVAMQSNTLKATIDAWMATGGMPGGGNSIPCPSVESPILSKAVEFCTWHAKASADGLPEDAKKEWNQKFIDVDQGTLFHTLMAANALDIKPLLDLACKAVADMMKGKTPEEIRAHFNIQNDFTPEEEEEVRRENAWCEDI